MSIEVRSIVQALRQLHRPGRRQPVRSRPASWLPSSDPPGAARPRCCASSPGSRCPTAAPSCSTAKMPPTATWRQRQVGFVFQHYALFRHMTVFENIAFGLRVKRRAQRPPAEQIRRKVRELLQLVQLDWLGRPLPAPALRRPAAAHRPRPGPRGRTQGAAARRTVRRARCQGAQGAAPLAAAAARRAARHQHLRHARSGGGARGRRSGRGDEQGQGRAGRHARTRSTSTRHRRS